MSTLPRTPVHFPRMRVRGSRNRLKLAARREHRTIIPYAVPVVRGPGHYVLEAVSGWQEGAVRVVHSVIRDGFGRVVPGTARGCAERVEPPPPPPGSMTFGFTVDSPDPGGLFDLLTGRGASADAT